MLLLPLRARSAWALAGILALTAAASARRVLAQSQQPVQPTVFVHGLMNTGATWQQTADRLAQDYAIRAYRPTLSSTSPYADQSVQLRSYISSYGLPDTTIAVGYSNGGVVSRKASADGQRFKGIITVASPNQGAALAQSMSDGRVFRFISYVTSALADPFYYYAEYWDDFNAWLARTFASVMYGVSASVPALAQALGYDAYNRIIPAMIPGSATFEGTGGLNSSANLTREASALRARVGVVSQIDPATGYFGITWQGVAPQSWGELTAVQYAAVSIFMYAFEVYANYWDTGDPNWVEKQNGAYLWLNAAGAVAVIDPMWCNFIGASGPTICTLSDGIVPVSSQEYPGSTGRYVMTGPAHKEVPTAGITASTLGQALSQRLGVARKIVSLAVSPSSKAIYVGDTSRLVAAYRAADGSAVAGAIGGWTSSNASVATVTSTGLVTARANGSATITAAGYGFAGSASITVSTASPISALALSGPTEVEEYMRGEWRVSVYGGAAPFTYVWTVNGRSQPNNTSARFSYMNSGSDFTLGVTVRDSRGSSRSVSDNITVTTTNCVPGEMC